MRLKTKLAEKQLKNNDKLYDDYKSNKISQRTFIKKAIKNHKILFNSIETINVQKCQLKNDQTKKQTSLVIKKT